MTTGYIYRVLSFVIKVFSTSMELFEADSEIHVLEPLIQVIMQITDISTEKKKSHPMPAS